MFKLPFGVNINNLIDDLRSLSWEVSDILIYYAQILKDSNSKDNIVQNTNKEDPVTIADLQVNDLIIKKINEKYKNINWEILSEESVKLGNTNIDTHTDWLWILDPLDGTRDFIQGTGNYAMHLALNYQGTPCIGIVLIPERDELWISIEGKVWCENRDGLKTFPNFSNNINLQQMNIVKSKNHKNQVLEELIDLINFKKVYVMGSIGCKIASILRGENDIYISLSLPDQSSPKDWDFAAPAAILKAAGGAVTNIKNEDLTFNQTNFEQKGIIIATNNCETHGNICSQIREIINTNNILDSDI